MAILGRRKKKGPKGRFSSCAGCEDQQREEEIWGSPFLLCSQEHAQHSFLKDPVSGGVGLI